MMEAACGTDSFQASLLLRALSAGKPPISGQGDRFFFGRGSELALLQRDLDAVAAGRSTFRIIVGDHGAGKSSLLEELSHHARRARFVTMRAELSRDCLLTGREGEARTLLEQALLGMRTLGSSDHCAMDALIGSFRGRSPPGEAATSRGDLGEPSHLASLAGLPRGHDFASVIARHGDALALSDERLAAKTRRWLLGHPAPRAAAGQDIGVPSLRDGDVWSMIKLWSEFVRLAGRSGLVLVIDEIRILLDLVSASRSANFAQIFRMFSEIQQGQIEGLALFLIATPAVVSREFNALCSEAGIGSCLHGGKSVGRSTDLIDPLAFQVSELDPDAVHELLAALRDLIGRSRPGARLIPTADIPIFIEQSRDQLGGLQFPLPRDLIRQFLSLHNRIHANPNLQWDDVLHGDVRDETPLTSLATASGQFVERML